MVSLHSLLVSILSFFHRLWTAVVGLLIFREKPTIPSQDIESGIRTSVVSRELAEDKVLDITRELSSDVLYLAPTSGGCVDIEVRCTEAIKYDHPNRRPSRRTSAVDPLKSRIVDATLKQVQDKTINFIKTITLTPSTVIAHPCTAMIEYYDSRNDHSDRCRIAERKPKGKSRAVQFIIPPIIVEDASTSSISTVFRDVRDHKPLRRHTESSIADLVGQFPLPPAHVPPTPPLPAAIRYITENLRKFSAFRVYSSPMVEQESINNAETGSITFAYSSGSDSEATADASALEMPLSNREVSNHFPAQSLSSSDDISYRSAQLLKEETHSLSVEDTLAPQSSPMSEQTLTNTAVLLVQPIEKLDHHLPKDSYSALKFEGPIERSHNVVDCFIPADLQKGDIFDDKCSKDKNLVSITQYGLEDMLRTSPSEDAIVDDLLAGLENSLDFDEQRMESTHYSETMEFLLTSIPSEDRSDVEKSVAPLRIVKKNRIQSSVEEERDTTQVETSWEESLEKVLQSFKDAETDDPNFRDLFCRDSSFLSQSSLVSGILGLPRYSHILSGPDRCHAERLKRLDESFESMEKSVEELLAELELLPDIIAIKTEEPAILNFSLSDVAVIQEIMDATVKPRTESVRLITSITGGDEGGEESYTWTAASQDEDEANSSEGENSQWSDLLGLDVCSD